VRTSDPTIFTTVFAIFDFITVSGIGYTERNVNIRNDKYGVTWKWSWNILGYCSRTCLNGLKNTSKFQVISVVNGKPFSINKIFCNGKQKQQCPSREADMLSVRQDKIPSTL
jgi:hypothetical protein